MYGSDEDAYGRIMESIVYFVDPKSPGSLSFLGAKERIRIPIETKHKLLDGFKRHVSVKTMPAGKNCGW